MTSLFRLSALASALLLAGCITVGPDYHRPVEKPVTLQGVDAAQQSARDFQANWWAQFNDPTLDVLIKRAAKNSPDLKIALARLNQSRAQLGTARSRQVPDIEAQTSYTRSREQQPGFTTYRETITSYQAGFDASWELDLFGAFAARSRPRVPTPKPAPRRWKMRRSPCSPKSRVTTSTCAAPSCASTWPSAISATCTIRSS